MSSQLTQQLLLNNQPSKTIQQSANKLFFSLALEELIIPSQYHPKKVYQSGAVLMMPNWTSSASNKPSTLAGKTGTTLRRSERSTGRIALLHHSPKTGIQRHQSGRRLKLSRELLNLTVSAISFCLDWLQNILHNFCLFYIEQIDVDKDTMTYNDKNN